MWRLHRYYLKELAVDSGITFVVLFGVVLVSLVARGIQRSQGGELVDAALITLFFALDAVPHLMTIAFLIGTVLTFSRASMDRELLAVRAAGIPARTPMTSAVLLGVLLSCVSSFALHYVIPEIHFRKYRVIADVARNVFLNLNLGSDRIRLPGASESVLTFADRAGHEYVDCTLYSPKPIPGARSPILRIARVSIPPVDERSEDILVVLRDVLDPLKSDVVRKVEFALDLHAVADRERRDDRDADLRSDQLLAEVLRGVHEKPHAAVHALFRRCCFALMPAMLAPIGFCIAELTRERGRVLALVVAIVPLMMFYLGEVLGARLLQLTENPWTAWLPAVLMAAVGVPLCWRQLRR